MLYEGLHKDSYQRVVSILTLLRKNILMNLDVTKSLKVITFNGETTKNLVMLHKWTKPREGNETFHDRENSPLTIEGRKHISVALCELLLPICSSYDHGIALPVKKDRIPCNGHSLSIIRLLSVSTLVDKQYRDIISSTLRTCPDIIKEYASHIQTKLEVGSNISFVSTMTMYSELVAGVEPASLATKPLPQILQLMFPEPITGLFISSVFQHPAEDLKLKIISLRIMHASLVLGYQLLKQKSMSADTAVQVTQYITKFFEEAVADVEDLLLLWYKLIANNSPDESMRDVPLILIKVLYYFVHFRPSSELKNKIKPEHVFTSALKITDQQVTDKRQLSIFCLQLTSSLQCKFDVFSQAKDEIRHQELVHIFELVLSRYVNARDDNDESDDTRSLIEEHIESTLTKYGFSSHTESVITPWLKALMGRNESCVEFLSNSIVATIASLETYYDQVVVITRNNTGEIPLELSFLSNKLSMWVEDSADITGANVPLCFSRLILGQLEILKQTPNEVLMEYFTEVMRLYMPTLPDPQVLARYLIGDSDLKLSPSIARYCLCWLGQKADKIEIPKGDTFATKLEYLFMSKDFSLVDEIIKTSLPKVLSENKTLLGTVFLYLQVDTMDSATEEKEIVVPSYLKIAQHILKSICKKFKSEVSKFDIYIFILEHPAIFTTFSIFHQDERYSLAVKLINEIIEAEPDTERPILKAYFQECYWKLKLHLAKDGAQDSINYVHLFQPFFPVISQLSDAHISLLMTILDAPGSFLQCKSFLKFACKIMDVVSSSPRLAVEKQSVHSTLFSYLCQYNYLLDDEEKQEDGVSGVEQYGFAALFTYVQRGLQQTMLPYDAVRLSHGKYLPINSITNQSNLT